jgi:hypothetical protein
MTHRRFRDDNPQLDAPVTIRHSRDYDPQLDAPLGQPAMARPRLSSDLLLQEGCSKHFTEVVKDCVVASHHPHAANQG